MDIKRQLELKYLNRTKYFVNIIFYLKAVFVELIVLETCLKCNCNLKMYFPIYSIMLDVHVINLIEMKLVLEKNTIGIFLLEQLVHSGYPETWNWSRHIEPGHMPHHVVNFEFFEHKKQQRKNTQNTGFGISRFFVSKIF